jgi:hypothetical protein
VPAPPEPTAAAPTADTAGTVPLPTQIIGQATAVIALALGVVYAAGGLSLGLKLWYLQDPWTPVLGQLPRDFVVFNAFGEVIVPAVIIGVIGYLCYEKAGLGFRQLAGSKLMPLLVAGWTAVLAFVPVLTMYSASRRVLPGVLRPYWQVFAAGWILNLVWITFLYALVRTSRNRGGSSRDAAGGPAGQVAAGAAAAGTAGGGQLRPLPRIAGMGIAILALIPFAAGVSASFPLPTVILCGSQFSHVDKLGRDYAIGNLIGTSGQWIYVAETRYQSRGQQHGRHRLIISAGRYIAVVPLTGVRLETLGQNPECNDLQATQLPVQSSPSPAASHPAS